MGIAGSAIASTAHQLKPHIFDFAIKRFDLFRNCEDLNSFLKSRNSSTNLNCEKRYLPLAEAKAILKLEIKK